MKSGFSGIAAVVAASLMAGSASAAPQAAVQFVSVSGTVSSADSSANTFTIKTDKGDETVVKFDDKTAFARVPPGETDTKKATPIQKSDVTAGDRVLARVRSGDNVSATAATRIYIMSKADLAKRDEKVQEDWATRSLTGIVQTVDPAAKQAVIKARGKDFTVDLGGKVTYRRYNPESTKTADMRPSSIAEIQPGDQFRVLGERNDDQGKVTAESVVTGAFRTVGLLVKSVDAAAGTISGTDVASKKAVVVKVTGESSIHRFEPMVANMLARQLNPNAASAGGRGGPGGANGTGGQPGGGARSGPPAGMASGSLPSGTPPSGGPPSGTPPSGGMPRSGGPGGMPGGGMRGGRPDIGKIVETQPKIQLGDIKPNDQLIVYGLVTPDLMKLAALNVLAGAEPILTAAPKGGVDPLGGNWNFGGGGGGEGGGPQ